MSYPLSNQALQVQTQFSVLMERLSALPAVDPQQVSDQLQQVSDSLAALSSTCRELEKCRENGELRIVNLLGSPVPDEALEAERDRLRALVESMTDEVWYCDLQGNVTMMNDRIVQNLGLDSVEELNLPIHEIVSHKLEIYRPDGSPRPEEEAPQIRSLNGETVRGQEYIRNLRTGELRWREYASAPIHSNTGEIIGAVGLARDITELRELQARQAENTAQMEVQRRLLEHREMERHQLARDLHDGPIQSLGALGFSLQIAQDIAEEGELKEMLQKMSREVKDLVAELRGVTNQLRPPLLNKFGLKQAIETHAGEFQSKYPEIRLTLQCAEEKNPLPDKIVLALYRVYQEGLNNIVRHSQATEVLVQLIFTPRHVIFQIKDNGVGLGSHIPSVHDWVELARQNHFGLVGMKERAEAVDGEFTIVSQPGKGTTIKITVPYS